MKEDMYLRIKQVTARTGLSRATIYGMMGIGTFPMKTALGVRAVGWLSSEIERWMLERKTAEKEGNEVRPGRKHGGLNATSSRLTSNPARAKTQPKSQQVVVVQSEDDVDWKDDSPPASGDEMKIIRARLQLNNRKKQGEIGSVKRSSKTLNVGVGQPDLTSSRQGKVTSKAIKMK